MPRQLPDAPTPARWSAALAWALPVLATSVQAPDAGRDERRSAPRSRRRSTSWHAGLTVAVGNALRRANGLALLVAAGGAVCDGAAVERVQAPLPYRTASVSAGLVTAVGTAIRQAVAPSTADDDVTTSI